MLNSKTVREIWFFRKYNIWQAFLLFISKMVIQFRRTSSLFLFSPGCVVWTKNGVCHVKQILLRLNLLYVLLNLLCSVGVDYTWMLLIVSDYLFLGFVKWFCETVAFCFLKGSFLMYIFYFCLKMFLLPTNTYLLRMTAGFHSTCFKQM